MKMFCFGFYSIFIIMSYHLLQSDTSSMPKVAAGRGRLIQIIKAGSSSSSDSDRVAAPAVEDVTKKFKAVTLPPVAEQEPVRKVGTAGTTLFFSTTLICIKLVQ